MCAGIWTPNNKVIKLKIIILLLFTLLISGGCASTPEKVPGKENTTKKTHFILKRDKMKDYPLPLPKYTSIWENWYQGETLVSKRIGYRGWDFDRDDQFDMLEILGEKGEITARAYDFDSDGKIDYIEQYHKDKGGTEVVEKKFLDIMKPKAVGF